MRKLIVFSFSVVLVVCQLIAHGAEVVSELSSQILDNHGKPIAGAFVEVVAAWPRQDPSDAPAKIPPLGKVVTTSADGRFGLDGLDPHLSYALVVWADKFKADDVRISDISKTTRSIKLKPQWGSSDPQNLIIGHVVDADGKPITGVVVRTWSEETANGPDVGPVNGVDELAVTGKDGVFRLVANRPGRKVNVLLRHPSFAPKLAACESDLGTDIVLAKGTSVVGRLLKRDAPVASVMMVLSQERKADRTRFLGDIRTWTDADGKFRFDHVPEANEYDLFASAQSLGERGSCAPITVTSNADATPLDAGELIVGPAIAISGKITVADGGKLPPTAIEFFQEDDGDRSQILADQDGKFKITGVRPGPVRLGINPDGLQPSAKNVSYFAGYRELLGKVDGDTTLEIELERITPENTVSSDMRDPRPFFAKPLQGVSADAK